MLLTSQQKQAIDQLILTKDNAIRFVTEAQALQKSKYANSNAYNNQSNSFTQTYASLLALLNDISEINLVIEYLSNLDFVHLKLAFTPSDTFLKKLQAVLTKQIGKVPAFDVTVDKSIIGGVVLDYYGNHKDLSFKNYVTQYFVANKNALLSKL